MNSKMKTLMGLLEGGKRVYQVKDGEVDADQFKYCAVLSQILFGPNGLCETLGSTWEMVHDPRFEQIENPFIVQKQAKFGGDAREGLQVQTADGTFTGSFAGLEQYSEMLGEGRYLIGCMKHFAVVEALNDLFPDRYFQVDAMNSHGALSLLGAYPGALKVDLMNAIYNAKEKAERALWDQAASDGASVTELWNDGASAYVPDFFERKGLLSPTEQIQVKEKAVTFMQYNPHTLQTWTDGRIWGLLRLEYSNYFTRKGMPNQVARTLFSIIKGGVCGLVADYAELPNVQETVLLEDPNTLYDPNVHGEDAPRVAMEVDLLERALTYRAELRVTATQILELSRHR